MHIPKVKKEMMFIGYKKCSTSNKAEKFLIENGLEFIFRDIKENKPEIDEIRNWHEKSGLDIKRLFNTSGQIYKKSGLKDKLANMTQEEKYELLSQDGMLVKRPILIYKDKVLFGFNEGEWTDLIGTYGK